jgi:uncharacterized protein (DUF2235 family)
MDFWEPGDRVFLFGFSRGAYTVRVLAGLLHALGLIPRGGSNLVPYLLRLLRAVRTESTGAGDSNVNHRSAFWEECTEFRRTFARDVSDPKRVFPIHFLGVWDTVSSVGWVWNPTTYPFTRRNDSVCVVRHAVSLDERRAFFRHNQFEQAANQNLQEMWFPGVHADVGGGYPEANCDFGLWRIPFQWMIEEAQKQGLRINDKAFDQALAGKKTRSGREWADQHHESLTPKWWPVEFLIKKHGLHGYRMNLFRRRLVPEGAMLHSSVLRRIRDPQRGYSPSNLNDAFLRFVREELTEAQIDGGHPYWPDGKPTTENAGPDAHRKATSGERPS